MTKKLICSAEDKIFVIELENSECNEGYINIAPRNLSKLFLTEDCEYIAGIDSNGFYIDKLLTS